MTTIRENAYQKFFRLLAQANEHLCPDLEHHLRVLFEADGSGELTSIDNETGAVSTLFEFSCPEEAMSYLSTDCRTRIIMSRNTR